MRNEERYVAQNKLSLAEAYGVSLKILNSWLKPIHDKIGPYIGKTYTPKQIEIIYKYLGKPNKYIEL